ncbi:MAG: hypothetical protein ACRC7W_00755 [Fusobacteriaceae bacterium]
MTIQPYEIQTIEKYSDVNTVGISNLFFNYEKDYKNIDFFKTISKGIDVIDPDYSYVWSNNNLTLTVTATDTTANLQDSTFQLNCLMTATSKSIVSCWQTITQVTDKHIVEFVVSTITGSFTDCEGVLVICNEIAETIIVDGVLDPRTLGLTDYSETQITSTYTATTTTATWNTSTLNSQTLANYGTSLSEPAGTVHSISYGSWGYIKAIAKFNNSGSDASYDGKNHYMGRDYGNVVFPTFSSSGISAVENYIGSAPVSTYSTLPMQTNTLSPDRGMDNALGGQSSNRNDATPGYLYPPSIQSIMHEEKWRSAGSPLLTLQSATVRWRCNPDDASTTYQGMSQSETDAISLKINANVGIKGSYQYANGGKIYLGGYASSTPYSLHIYISYVNALCRAVGTGSGYTVTGCTAVMTTNGNTTTKLSITPSTAIVPDASKVKISYFAKAFAGTTITGSSGVIIIDQCFAYYTTAGDFDGANMRAVGALFCVYNRNNQGAIIP